MKYLMIAAIASALGLSVPAHATDEGNANAEQQTKPTPNRGGTSGGPAHDVRDKVATDRDQGEKKSGKASPSRQ